MTADHTADETVPLPALPEDAPTTPMPTAGPAEGATFPGDAHPTGAAEDAAQAPSDLPVPPVSAGQDAELLPTETVPSPPASPAADLPPTTELPTTRPSEATATTETPTGGAPAPAPDAPVSPGPKVWTAAGATDAPAPAPGAHWRDAEESAPAWSAKSGDSAPRAGEQQKVWTAADARDLQPAPSGGVRVGQLVWACIVLLTGVFLIAMAFFDVINVPVVLIALVGVLGLSLIGAALIVGKEPSSKRDRL